MHKDIVICLLYNLLRNAKNTIFQENYFGITGLLKLS